MTAAVVLGLGPADPAPPDTKLTWVALADSGLSQPWSRLYRIFITTSRGWDASDKYHK